MANRYFLNIGANWNDTANWATTSGGTGGETIPSALDDVFFDVNSGNCAVDASSLCNDLNFTGYTNTFSGSSALAISGSLILDGTMTRTYTGAITFNSTGSETLTFDGKTTASNFTFDGTGSWTVQDAWNNGTSTITLTSGSFDTNDQTITIGTFSSSNSNTRALDLGSSTLNLRFNWLLNTSTGLTFSAGTSTIAHSADGTINFQGGGLTYNIVTLTSTSSTGVINIVGGNTFSSLTIATHAVKTARLSLSSNQIISGTITITGNSLTNRILVQSDTVGVSKTITAATTTLSNCDFQDVTGAGAGSWSGTSIGNALGNSGITFTTPVTRYAVTAGNWSSTGMWSATSGGASGASVPLCHDTVILNASSGAGTYTADMPRLGADITCTGFTRTLAFTSTANYIFGSLTLASGMTFSTSQSVFFRARSSKTLTNSGQVFNRNITFEAVGGTYTLQDALNVDADYGTTVSNGTFDANDFNVSIGFFSASSGTTITMGSGTWSLTGILSVWTINSGATLNAESSIINISDGSTFSKTFSGGSKTYNILRLSGASIAQYTISGSNTFSTLESTKTFAHSILFTTGTTQTITNWNISGSSGNVVTINSTTTGTHTLTKAGGGQVRSDYLSIQHSVATPSNTWYAGLNSTDNQAVATAGSGWLFTVPLPTVTTQAVSAITDVTALGNGNITDDGSGTVTERGFVYDLATKSAPSNVSPASSGYASVATDTGTFTEGAFTKSITGLTPLTTYYVRAYCENEAGYDYGDEVSFTTGETPEVAIVTTQDPTSVTATTATGNGTIVDANGTVTRRGFAVSTSTHSDPSNTDPDVSDYEVVFSASGSFTEGAYTTSLTGLTIDTTYYIRAFTENGEGFSYGSELSFMTDRKPSVTIQAPTNRQSTTVTLNGTVTDAGGDTIDSRGFVWDTVTQSAPGDVAPASSGYDFTQGESGTLTAGVFDEAITGLDPNATYYVRAYAQNTQGYTYTDEISFSTITFPNTTIIINEDTNTISVTNTETTLISGIINQSTNTASIINQDI